MQDIENSIEDDFLDLVNYAPSKEGFVRGAKLMLGDDWRVTGKQIVSQCQPDLMKKFESYIDAYEIPAK